MSGISVADNNVVYGFFISGRCKECLDSIAFSATHTQTTVDKETNETKENDYNYDITGLNNNDSDKKVFVDGNGNEYENNYNVEVFSYTDDKGVKHRLRCYTKKDANKNIVPIKLVDKDNKSLPTRAQDRFQVRPEDITYRKPGG